MRGYVRSSLLAASLIAASAPVSAGTDGIYLPPAPTGPGGEDRVETGSGSRCSQSINSNGAYLDVGMAGSSVRGRDDFSSPMLRPDRVNGSEALGYARVTIPLGHRPNRIDCTRLYELELQRLRREIELLKMAAE